MSAILEKLHVQYISNEKGEKISVILPIEEFVELLEDLEDNADISGRKNEKIFSHDEVISELKKDGFL